MTYQPNDPEFYAFLRAGMPEKTMEKWRRQSVGRDARLKNEDPYKIQRDQGILSAYIDGKTYPEIAEAFAMPEGSIHGAITAAQNWSSQSDV